MSLSDYLRAELQRTAERPTVAELRRRLAERSRVDASETAAMALRAERELR